MVESKSEVNSKITDAITQTTVSVLGESPAQSMGLVYQAMAQSVSLLMQNAVMSQGGLQQINTAVISTACREIMSLSQPRTPPPTTNNHVTYVPADKVAKTSAENHEVPDRSQMSHKQQEQGDPQANEEEKKESHDRAEKESLDRTEKESHD